MSLRYIFPLNARAIGKLGQGMQYSEKIRQIEKHRRLEQFILLQAKMVMANLEKSLDVPKTQEL